MSQITAAVTSFTQAAGSRITAAETFPIVDKMGDLAKNTATALGGTLVIAIGIIIAIGLIWSHIGDRETGKWWKAMGVWVIGAAVIAGIAGLYTWTSSTFTI